MRVSLLDAVMYYMASDFQSCFISGEPPRASGSRHSRAPMVGVFQTRNGHLLLGEVLRDLLGYSPQEIAALQREQEQSWNSRSGGGGRM